MTFKSDISKKKLFLTLLFFMNYILIFANSFEISVRNVDVSCDGKNQFVCVELDYKIKNEGERDLFLYDINKGNDMQYEQDSCVGDKISKKIFVFKPSKISAWSGSWAYSPNYPSFIKICPSDFLKGSLRLKYKIPKSINPQKMTYDFNFIFADCDVFELLATIPTDEINERFLHNETVSFKLRP